MLPEIASYYLQIDFFHNSPSLPTVTVGTSFAVFSNRNCYTIFTILCVFSIPFYDPIKYLDIISGIPYNPVFDT